MKRTLTALAIPLMLISGAASAKVTSEKVDRVSAEKVVVTWSDKAPVDVYVSESADATMATAKLVSRADADGTFESAVAPGARVYFLLKDTKDNTLVRVAERALPLDHGSNFRDLGGYETKDGKHVRWGKIFRSGGQPMLSEGDLATTHALGLKDLIDLRSSEERVLAPTRINGVRYTAVGYSMMDIAGPGGPPTQMSQVGEAYKRMPALLAPQIRDLFHALRANEGPIAYNCSAGQDRTGFATALILTALGVPRDTIYADYHLSTTYRNPAYEMPKINAAAYPENPTAQYFAKIQEDGRMSKPQPLYDSNKKPLLQYAFEEIEGRYGSVEAYLDKEIGVKPSDIAKLRAAYLE